jgi:colanic acid/amylovoran biosynthesis protein
VFAADSLGVPFVALTQAIGPFGERTSRIIANYCVRRMAMLFVRGSESARHLAELHADPSGNAIRCSDIAYLFEPAQREQAEALLPRREAGHPLVGIVPNVNVYFRTSPRGKANPYVRGLAALCNDVTERLHGQVVVVCHESHDRPEKDDRALADLVRDSCRNPAAVHVIPPCHPAAVLKATLRELDFVVASRFHSLVASISLARPFLAVGWSHKYQELVDETGMVGVMLDGRELEPDVLVKQFQSAWERREELQKSLDDVVGGLRASAAKPFDYLQEQWFPTRPTGSVVLE